jgi:hypothetical protein
VCGDIIAARASRLETSGEGRTRCIRHPVGGMSEIVVRAPRRGLSAAYVALLGLLAAAWGPLTGAPEGFTVGLPLAALCLLFGIRIARCAVAVGTDGLVARNRFSTRRVPWTEVSAIAAHDKPLGRFERVLGVRHRRAARVDLTSGGAIWLDATESYGTAQLGTAFTTDLAGADRCTRTVVEAWRALGDTAATP